MEKVSIIAQLKFKSPADMQATIIIRGFYNRKPVASKSTGYKIRRHQWDTQARKVINHNNELLLNTCLQNRLNEIQSELLQKEIMGTTITPTHVANAVRGNNPALDFIAYCTEKIKEHYHNIDSIRTCESDVRKLKKFKPSIFFSDITPKFLLQYKNFMRDELNNSPNTQWKSLKFIYRIVNIAMKEGGIIKTNPFTDFDRGCYVEMPKPYLVTDEINKVEDLLQKDIPPLLQKITIRFLLMCYSGMRFGDAMKFNPELHTKDGRFIMQYQKFSGQVNYLMHQRLVAIIEKVKEHPLKISGQHFNSWLKVMAKLCHINKNITTHTGRHTFGFMLSEKSVPKEKARLLMAHKNIKSTNTYYHITESQVDREIMKLDEL